LAPAPSSRACSTAASCASDSRGAGPLGALAAQGLRPAGLEAAVPDADGLGGDTELAGDLGLADASGEQLGGPQPPGLEPFAFSLCRRAAREGRHAGDPHPEQPSTTSTPALLRRTAQDAVVMHDPEGNEFCVG
jgi:hypothetical protein